MTFLRKQWWRILSVHIKFAQIQQQLSGFEPRQILAETIVFVCGMWIKQMGLLSHSCRQLSSSPSYRFTCIHVITINVLMACHYTGVFNEIWGKNVPISIDYYCYSQMSALLWTWTFTYIYSTHTHLYKWLSHEKQIQLERNWFNIKHEVDMLSIQFFFTYSYKTITTPTENLFVSIKHFCWIMNVMIAWVIVDGLVVLYEQELFCSLAILLTMLIGKNVPD